MRGAPRGMKICGASCLDIGIIFLNFKQFVLHSARVYEKQKYNKVANLFWQMAQRR